jgi:nicotinate-nucleotide pyrophosphorylase (carboxylating)
MALTLHRTSPPPPPPRWNPADTPLARRLLELARDEDLGHPPIDQTAALFLDPEAQAAATVVLRSPGTVAGLALAPLVLEVFAADDLVMQQLVDDGTKVNAGTPLLTLSGSAARLVAVERTLLNLLGRLSGIATLTAAFVDAAGGKADIYDTRKTTPGLRVLEKYAVRCGRGHNHRLGLFAAVLIKDNHLAASITHRAQPGATRGNRSEILTGPALTGALTSAARAARSAGAGHGNPDWFFEVEVDRLDQLEAVLAVEPGLIDIALLDNFSFEDLAIAADRRAAAQPGLRLEASGGVSLATVPAIAATGVDRISAGSLTHAATSLDIGLDA